jgi:hypothetical protein
MPKRNISRATAFMVGAIIIAMPAVAAERRNGGKLLLTNGVSSVEGAAGGGLATWAIIAGNETEDGIGATAHATYVSLPDYDLASAGAAIGISDRLELSYAYQRFDTGKTGKALGLGENFKFGQHILGAKLKLIGNAVWDQDTILPQISAGIQYKIAEKGNIIHAVGGRETRGADFFVSATKVVLAQGLVINGTVRFTKANQFGLLGFGGDRHHGRSAQVEGSIGKLLTRKLVVGVEYRTKPDNLGFAKEDDSYDLFAAWALHRNLSLTLAYADLGYIATFKNQRGLFLSLQGAF